MDLLRCLRVHAVEEVLEAALVLVIGEVNQLLKLLFEPIPQEAVVDAGHASHIDADDAKVLHLLSGKA